MTIAFHLPQEIHDEIIHATKKYPEGQEKAALKTALMAVQKKFGYLSKEMMDAVAQILKIEPMSVYEVAHFYTLYRLQPGGKYELAICTNVSCWLRGAESLLQTACRKLNIQPGQTSADGLVSLKETECLAACGQAPAFQINGQYTGPWTEEELIAWLEDPHL